MKRIAFVAAALGGTLSLAAPVAEAEDYRLTQEPDRSRQLRVTVERSAPDREDTLVLRGAGFGVGVKPQVEQASCDRAVLAPACDEGAASAMDAAGAESATSAVGGAGAESATSATSATSAAGAAGAESATSAAGAAGAANTTGAASVGGSRGAVKEGGGVVAWRVPRGCRQLTWLVPLDLPGTADASAQRSLRSGDGTFTFFSEASSLPRLASPSGADILVVPASAAGSGAAAMPDRRLQLPTLSEPPLFVLMASAPTAERASGRVRVSYFLDDVSQLAHVPSIDSVLTGLQWLGGLVPSSDRTHFTYAWIGVSSGARSIGGAAGREVLAVNYIRDGSTETLRAGLIAATPFIEASHQLAGSLGERPAWAEESLAMYFGLRALEHARPGDDTAAKLLRRFESDSAQFPAGLIEVHRRVSSGDRSMYAAYFTKGVAFWSAVDAALRAAGEPGLPSRLLEVWTARYDKDGRPDADFPARLKLPASGWKALSDKYLGPG